MRAGPCGPLSSVPWPPTPRKLWDYLRKAVVSRPPTRGSVGHGEPICTPRSLGSTPLPESWGPDRRGEARQTPPTSQSRIICDKRCLARTAPTRPPAPIQTMTWMHVVALAAFIATANAYARDMGCTGTRNVGGMMMGATISQGTVRALLSPSMYPRDSCLDGEKAVFHQRHSVSCLVICERR